MTTLATLHTSRKLLPVAPQNLHRVFERFEQIRDEREGMAGGTGIGLPLSRALAEMHGGTLELDSEEGIGTPARLFLSD